MGALIAARAKRLMLLGQPVRPLASNVMKENLHCLVHANVLHVQKGFTRRRILRNARNAQLGDSLHPIGEHVNSVVLVLSVLQEQ